MDRCKPNPGSDSTAELRIENGIKDINDIILTLRLPCSASQIRVKKKFNHCLHPPARGRQFER